MTVSKCEARNLIPASPSFPHPYREEGALMPADHFPGAQGLMWHPDDPPGRGGRRLIVTVASERTIRIPVRPQQQS